MRLVTILLLLLGVCSFAPAQDLGAPLAQLKIPKGTTVRQRMENKTCGSCGREVSFINTAGMKCEHCGAQWQLENHRDGSMTRVEGDGQHVYYTAEQRAQGVDAPAQPPSEGALLLGGVILVVILLVGVALLLALVLTPIYIALRLTGVIGRRR